MNKGTKRTNRSTLSPYWGSAMSADGGLVFLDHIGGNPAAGGDRNPLLLGPFPHRLGVNSGRSPRGGDFGGSPARAYLTSGGGEFTQCLSQRCRVLLAHVNLLDAAVQSEGDGLGRLSSVDVVNQGDGRLLGPVRCAFLVVWSNLVNADASIGPLRWPSPARMSCNAEHLTGRA